jgi:hypothetical protein
MRYVAQVSARTFHLIMGVEQRPSYFINRYGMYDNRTLYPASVQMYYCFVPPVARFG